MRVVVAEDQLLTREGIVRVLTSADVEVAGEAVDADELMALVATEAPDAAVVDIRMAPTHTDEGLVAAARIRREFPRTAWIRFNGRWGWTAAGRSRSFRPTARTITP